MTGVSSSRVFLALLVAVTTGWTTREVLSKERPDYLLDDLGELLRTPGHAA